MPDETGMSEPAEDAAAEEDAAPAPPAENAEPAAEAPGPEPSPVLPGRRTQIRLLNPGPSPASNKAIDRPGPGADHSDGADAGADSARHCHALEAARHRRSLAGG